MPQKRNFVIINETELKDPLGDIETLEDCDPLDNQKEIHELNGITISKLKNEVCFEKNPAENEKEDLKFYCEDCDRTFTSAVGKHITKLTISTNCIFHFRNSFSPQIFGYP